LGWDKMIDSTLMLIAYIGFMVIGLFTFFGILDIKMIIDMQRKGYHDTKKYRYTRVKRE